MTRLRLTADSSHREANKRLAGSHWSSWHNCNYLAREDTVWDVTVVKGKKSSFPRSVHRRDSERLQTETRKCPFLPLLSLGVNIMAKSIGQTALMLSFVQLQVCFFLTVFFSHMTFFTPAVCVSRVWVCFHMLFRSVVHQRVSLLHILIWTSLTLKM